LTGPCTNDNQCSSITDIDGNTVQLVCFERDDKINQNGDEIIPGCENGGVGDQSGLNYCVDPKYKDKTSKDMYNADVSLPGTRFGGTYPEGTLRLQGIAGAEFIPFYVRAATRTKAGWSKSIEISCSPPAIGKKICFL